MASRFRRCSCTNPASRDRPRQCAAASTSPSLWLSSPWRRLILATVPLPARSSAKRAGPHRRRERTDVRTFQSLLWDHYDITSTIRGRLDAVKLGVLPASGDEFVVAACFNHAGAVKDDDLIGHSNSTETVRDKDGDAAA